MKLYGVCVAFTLIYLPRLSALAKTLSPFSLFLKLCVPVHIRLSRVVVVKLFEMQSNKFCQFYKLCEICLNAKKYNRWSRVNK